MFVCDCARLSASRSFSYIHNWMWACVCVYLPKCGRATDEVLERWASVDKRFWTVWKTYRIDTIPSHWFHFFFTLCERRCLHFKFFFFDSSFLFLLCLLFEIDYRLICKFAAINAAKEISLNETEWTMVQNTKIL